MSLSSILDINEYPNVSWCFANYIKTTKNIHFFKLSLEKQKSLYSVWYNNYYDVYDKSTSKMFIHYGYNIMNIHNILFESKLVSNTFYLNVNTKNKVINSSITQIWCEKDSSEYYGFHKLYKTISKDNKIHTIYFGMNGIGCNANDYYTKDHLLYEEMLDDNSLFTPQNKQMMQMEFEKLISLCPLLVNIHICGYHFQCSTDTTFFKSKNINVYKIYNYDCDNYDEI